MSQTCPQELHISLLHDGELSPDQDGPLQQHLRACPACQKYAHALQRLDQTLLDDSAHQPRAARTRPWAPALAMATVVLALGLGAHLSPPPRQQKFAVSAPSGETYAVTVKGQAQLLSIEINGTTAQFDQ